jgi:hypothetical protein
MTGHVMLWPDAIQVSLLDEFSKNLPEREGLYYRRCCYLVVMPTLPS